jgi:hypothetical protein
MQQWKEQEKDFSDYCPAEKRVHFFGKRYCVKCTGKSNAGRKSGKAQILDTAFSSGVERCRSKTFSIL